MNGWRCGDAASLSREIPAKQAFFFCVIPAGRVLFAGEVQGLQVVPRAGSPSLEVTVGDGTGRVVTVFTGRRRLGGVDVGRRILVDGVVRRERARLVVMNPAYTIVE